MPRTKKPASPFRYFNSSPDVIRLVVMLYVRFPLSLVRETTRDLSLAATLTVVGKNPVIANRKLEQSVWSM